MSVELDAIQERLNTATPGNWEAAGTPHDEDGLTTIFSSDEDGDLTEPIAMASERDAEFIAHTPTDIAFLLECVHTLEGQRDIVLDNIAIAIRDKAERAGASEYLSRQEIVEAIRAVLAVGGAE